MLSFTVATRLMWFLRPWHVANVNEKLHFYVLKILVDINLNLNSHVYLVTIVMLSAVL